MELRSFIGQCVEEDHRQAPSNMMDLVHVGEVEVDLEAIYGVTFECDALLCRGIENCCSRYDVVIDDSEREKLLGLLPGCAEFQPSLWGVDGPENPFDDSSDDGLYSVDQDDNGCVILYDGTAGEKICALHSTALALGLDPYVCKPLACTLWPLILIEGQRVILGLDSEVFDFPCASAKERPDTRLPQGFRRTLQLVFSDAWLGDLEQLAQQLLPPPG